MPRTQILLTLTALLMSGLTAAVTHASASTTEMPELVATIDVGAGTTPYGIAVTPDGSKVFVSNSTAGSVSVIDTSTRSVNSTITSNVGTTPVGITIDASGSYAYVANYAAGTVTRITIGTGATSAIDISATVLGACRWPLNIALTPSASTLWVACQDNGRVISAPVSGGSGTGTVWMSVSGTFPTDVALSADGSTAVSSLSGSNQAWIIDGSGSAFVSVAAGPFAVAVSPTTGLAYLAAQTAGALSVVNTTSRSTVGSTITVGGSLSDIAITPDGSQAIVSVVDEDVVKFIDLATGTVTHTVGVGGTDPQSIALSRDGRFLYTANRSGSVGVITVPVSQTSSTSNDGTPIFELEFTAGDDARCSTSRWNARKGAWITLPAADDCTAPVGTPTATLLGWATTSTFPVDIARRQVNNGWGAYEMFDDAGRLTSVFIPAGGATLVTAPGTLHAIWSSEPKSQL